MDLWIIQAQEHLADPRETPHRRAWRSNTLAEVLGDRGHRVTRWRSSFSHHQKRQLSNGSERVPAEGYDVQFIATSGYRRHVGPRRVLSHRALARSFSRLADDGRPRPDLIHVGNVPIELCLAAVEHGRRHGVPVVVDVRDLWPDLYLDLVPARLPWIRTLADRFLNRPSSPARRALRGATGITALTASYLEWALDKAGRDQRAADAVVPMAYPELAPVDPAALVALQDRLGTSLADRMVVAYAGNLGTQSDFETVLRAARSLAADHPEIMFVLAGDGPALASLREQSADLPSVHVPGWLDAGSLRALLDVASIGLVAYHPTQNFLLNVPNKLPEYLAAGLAVACSVEGEMGALVRESGCGFVYASGDVTGLARGLSGLAQDHQALAGAQARALALHRDRFSAHHVYPVFADHLEEVAAS